MFIHKNKACFLVVVLLMILIIQCFFSMRLKSPTFDEVGHLPAGLSYLLTNDYRLYPINPPLIKQLAAIPLLFLDLNIPFDHQAWQDEKAIEFGRQFLFFYYNDADTIIFLGRSVMVLLSALLGIYVFKFSKRLFGVKAGLFALFLYVFQPNILAYSQMVTTDMGFACFAFIALYYFFLSITEQKTKYWILLIITLGLSFASKFTAILLMPCFLFAAVLYLLLTKQLTFPGGFGKKTQAKTGYATRLTSLIFFLSITFCAGTFIAMLDYGFKSQPLIKKDTGELRLKKLLGKLPIVNDPELIDKIVGFAKKVPVPARDYFVRQAQMLGYKPKLDDGSKQKAPYEKYLIGETSDNGFWYFSFIALLIKEPLPFIAMLIIALFFIKNFELPKMVFVLVPIALFLCAGVMKNSFAYRYINLPILPLLIVFASKIITEVSTKRILAFSLPVLCIWYVTSSIMIYPHYLSYFNETIGGSVNGHKYMVNSNYDWGQDLKLLKRYMDKKDISKIKLSYFGSADPDYYGIHHEPLRGISGRTFDKDITESPKINTKPTSGLIAISATCLENIDGFYPGESYDWLKQYEPIDRVGHSIFIYDIPEKE